MGISVLNGWSPESRLTLPWSLCKLKPETFCKLQVYCALWTREQWSQKFIFTGGFSMAKQKGQALKVHSLPASWEESSYGQSEGDLIAEEFEQDYSSEDPSDQPLSSDELKMLLSDSERVRLLRKLSESNQQNRFLKRQLQSHDDTWIKFKRELATLELEIQALLKLAEEVANYAIPEGSRKIKGKYIQSHLLFRLAALQEKLQEQIKDVAVAEAKDVSISWYGMAESVQVMGSFDGWTLGEELSPEYTGIYTSFSTTLRLRPGRYEIKFMVDGEWQLSPEFPTIGEGLMKNNLLVVD